MLPAKDAHVPGWPQAHRRRSESALGEMAECAREGLTMQSDLQRCRHQLKRPPDLVTDGEDISYLLFECILCGCGISLRLDAQGEIDGEFIIPPDRKCA